MTNVNGRVAAGVLSAAFMWFSPVCYAQVHCNPEVANVEKETEKIKSATWKVPVDCEGAVSFERLNMTLRKDAATLSMLARVLMLPPSDPRPHIVSGLYAGNAS